MFSLEKDKRGPENRVLTQYHNLPTWDLENGVELADDCFREGFYIPENVVLLGTMNDIDRSVESFDFALRRRFTWLEVEVTEALLADALPHLLPQRLEGLTAPLTERICALNRVIEQEGGAFGLNKHYFISQGHFTNLPDSCVDLDSSCDYVWRYRLANLLEEYVRGEAPEDIRVFLDRCSSAFLQDAPAEVPAELPAEETAEEPAEESDE